MAKDIVGPLLATLEVRDILSSEERDLLLGLPWRIKDFDSGEEMIKEGSRPAESCLLVSGFCARTGYVRDGQRQLTAVHVPGDFVDLHGFFLKIMDHSVIALPRCRAAFVEHSVIERITQTKPHLSRVLMMTIAIDAATQRNWLVSLGRRNPTSHLAHLVCELYMRLSVVGLAKDHRFEFPISQTILADLLGLSLVHTNRTLQDLRGTGLITWREGRITIENWEKLKRLGDFDPLYLNLFQQPR